MFTIGHSPKRFLAVTQYCHTPIQRTIPLYGFERNVDIVKSCRPFYDTWLYRF